MTDVDVVIVGGGSAGLAAALMLGRARRSVVVVDDGRPRNAPAEHVHGYLGREGVAPAELLAIGRAEVAAYGVEVRPGRVVRLERRHDGAFDAELADGTIVGCRRVLVATGLRDELPPIPGVAERWGRDVLHCPYCHGWEVRDQRIVVLSTSEWGAFQASLWRQWSDDVTLVVHSGPAPTSAEREQLGVRGVTIVEATVAGLVVADDRLEGIRLDDGTVVPAAAVVVAPRMIANGELLASLGIEPVDAPRGVGTTIPADAMGATSVPGLYVAGNVSNAGAHVLSAAASGAQAGAAINADLVSDDTERARRPVMDRAFWEDRYRSKPQVWSGQPNPHLVTEVAGLTPGTALDVGAGEGADAIWLAEHGWKVTAVDLSSVALDRGRQRAEEVGVADRITWRQADLTTWTPPAGAFDLVTAHYLHPPPEARSTVYAAIAGAVAPGGTLLLVGHHPSDMDAGVGRPRWPEMFATAEELAATTLDDGWTVVATDARPRQVTDHDGNAATAHDAVLVARRGLTSDGVSRRRRRSG